MCFEDVTGGRVFDENVSGGFNVGMLTPSGRSLSGSRRGEHGRDVLI